MEPSEPAEGTEPEPRPVVPDPPLSGPAPETRTLDEATAAEREEVRRLVDSGATTPEDLRALAEKIREQRAREEEVWRNKIKPDLMESKKGGLRLSNLRKEGESVSKEQRKFLLVVAGVVLLVLLLLTISSASLLVVVVLLVALLVYAYVIGRRSADDDPAGDGEPEG